MMKDNYTLCIANIECECSGINEHAAMRSTGLIPEGCRIRLIDNYQNYNNESCWIYRVELN